MLTTGEAAQFCGVSFRTVSRWVERGLLNAFELPGRGDKRIEVEEFVRFLLQNGMPIPKEFQDTNNFALVVDDDVPMANSMARVLRRAGIETFIAHDGFSAGALLEQRHPQLLVLDLNMPGLGGSDVLHFVRNSPRLAGIKVLVVSGMPKHELEKARDAGADDILEKPFSGIALRERAFRLLGSTPGEGVGKEKPGHASRTNRQRENDPTRR